MKYEFDFAKNATNIKKHGIDMQIAAEFDFDAALIRVDQRKDYGEVRYQALGYFTGRLHSVAFTMRRDDSMRVISFRKASRQEKKIYEQSKK